MHLVLHQLSKEIKDETEETSTFCVFILPIRNNYNSNYYY